MNKPGRMLAKKIGAWMLVFVFLFSALVPNYVKEGRVNAETAETETMPESVKLFSDELRLDLIEDTGKIKPEFSPAGTEETVTYASRNEDIAIVEEDGTVLPVRAGKTKIDVTTERGLSAVCDVVITDASEKKADKKDAKKADKKVLKASRSGETTAALTELKPDVDTVLNRAKNYILKKDPNPTDSVSAWTTVALARSGVSVPQSYYDTYYKNTVAKLEKMKWKLRSPRSTEWVKLIMALTAIGKDVTNIKGHNLFDNLSDFNKVNVQGFNGPIWALTAVNLHPNYDFPKNPKAKIQTTKEYLVDYIVKYAAKDGGWGLDISDPENIKADADMTGMAIQALAPYYGKRDDVTAAVNKALKWLEKNQYDNGGWGSQMGSGDNPCSESTVQVIVALTALGFDPAKPLKLESEDTVISFVRKNGNWPVSGLFEYYMDDTDKTSGGFMHLPKGIVSPGMDNGAPESGIIDGMATEQGMYGTASYKRYTTGQTSLYDMSDVDIKPDTTPSKPSVTPDTGDKPETHKPGTVKILSIILDYSEISLTKGQDKFLTAKVSPINATNQKLKWKSSNTKVAVVNSNGKVTGKKAGVAKITATAKDGSGKKATCTVTVKDTTPTTTTPTTPVKKPGQSSVVSTSRPAPVRATTRSGAATTTAKGKNSSSTAGGWSFAGEDYVPESNTSAAAATTAAEKETAAVPSPGYAIFYASLGGGAAATGILLIGVLVWILYRRGRKRGTDTGLDDNQ